MVESDVLSCIMTSKLVLYTMHCDIIHVHEKPFVIAATATGLGLVILGKNWEQQCTYV